jgi:hypothetical protein
MDPLLGRIGRAFTVEGASSVAAQARTPAAGARAGASLRGVLLLVGGTGIEPATSGM